MVNFKDVLLNIAMIPGTNRSVASLIDITERKRSEQNLFAANEELGATLEQLKATEEELRHQIVLLQEKERQVRHVSMHDALTGLTNRGLFLRNICAAWRVAATIPWVWSYVTWTD